MIFPRKRVHQVAALPFVCFGDEVEVLLVTSRRRGRWVLPKGWTSARLGAPASAAREARQEAGAIGLVAETPIGSYAYEKAMRQGYAVPANVGVYPLLVTEQRLKWRERDQRKMRWVPLADAARMVDDAELRELLSRLVPDAARRLRAHMTVTAPTAPAPVRGRGAIASVLDFLGLDVTPSAGTTTGRK
ncbi:MAG: NUDIX hydrolase [Alphaproteobacteria bacterium]|mgnify:CR=1 FL=1|nr:NUDIX hydrolase [Alphaproteobacteria bacterium]MDX5368613.1 NUDIX hydrolase [Alphaproteobacteria bacterium]MDX5463358.1 NUDIX hydrolase [Alphaproteobacteria bacterium]